MLKKHRAQNGRPLSLADESGKKKSTIALRKGRVGLVAKKNRGRKVKRGGGVQGEISPFKKKKEGWRKRV